MRNVLPKTLILALALPLAWSAGSSSLQAQTFSAPLQVTGPSPADFEFRADGTLIAKGATGTGSLLSTDQGAGTRLLWYPALAAFRAGSVSSYNSAVWDLANIGEGSVAFGLNTTASGYGSSAFGLNTIASGDVSSAFGYQTTASGQMAVAMGSVTTASGYYALSTGIGTVASGFAATALGYCTVAGANASTAVGSYNVGGGDPNNQAAGDPLFEVGNGTYQARSDALVVYRNGSASFQGVVTVAPGGDIPMYMGN